MVDDFRYESDKNMLKTERIKKCFKIYFFFKNTPLVPCSRNITPCLVCGNFELHFMCSYVSQKPIILVRNLDAEES